MEKRLLRAVLTTVGILLCCAGGAQAEWISLSGGPEAQPRVTVTQESNQTTRVEIEVFGYDTEIVTIEGRTYVDIGLPGYAQLLERGLPQLPSIPTSLIIPDQGTPTVRIVKTETVELATLPVAPSKGAILRTVDPATVPYEFGPVYQQGGVFPAAETELGEPYIVRDHRGVTARVFPFRYDAGREILVALKSIIYEVVTEGTGGVNPKTRQSTGATTVFHNLYTSQFANYDGAAKYTINGGDGPLLIVCYDAFVGDMQPFVEWKQQRGLDVELVTTSECGGTTTGIKAVIEDRYNSPEGLAFVVLVGDGQQLPVWAGGYEGANDDTRYVYLEGDDLYPDALVSRISAQNPVEVQVQVAKFVEYERDPTPGASWYGMGCGIASNEGNPPDYEYADDIRDKLLLYGFTHADQIYQGQGGDTQMITDAINQGRSTVYYIGHGSGTSWSSVSFNNSNVHALTNDEGWPWIIDVACLNGGITAIGESFGEAWMRAGTPAVPYGALGFYGSSTSCPWVPPLVMQTEVYDLLVGDVSNNLGVLVHGGIMAVLDTYGQGGTGQQLVEQYNLFGDCSMQVRTAVPNEMTVAHQPVVPLLAPTFAVDTGVPNVTCALYADGVLHGAGVTDLMGHADIELTVPVAEVGLVTLTCFGYNQLTYQVELQAVVPADVAVVPATVPVSATTAVTVTVTDPDTGLGMADINIWISGYGFQSAAFTTGASGEVTLDVLPEYGETLVVHGQEIGAGYEMFSVGLPVTGALDLNDVAIAAEVAAIGLVGSLTPHIEGTVTASAQESNLTLYLSGGGVDLSASDPGNTVVVNVTPTELSEITAALAKPGCTVHEVTIPVVEAFGTLAGAVSDPIMNPIADARVYGFVQGDDPTGTPLFDLVSDAGGQFAVPDDLPVGYYDVYAVKYGYAPFTETVFLAYGANNLGVVLDHAPAGEITGTVTAGEDGSPLEATLRVFRSDTGEQIDEVTTDPATGVYTTGPLPFYDYRVTARSFRRIPQTVGVTVGAAQVVQDFVMQATEGDLLLIDDNPRGREVRPAKLLKDTVEIAPAYDAPPSRSAADMAAALEDAGYTVIVELSSLTNPVGWFTYDAVVVSCGDNLGPLTDTTLRNNLHAFANAGYKMLLEGGELAYDMHFQDPGFLADVLHVSDWNADSAGDVTVDDAAHPVMSFPNAIAGPIDFAYAGYGDSDATTVAADAVQVGAWSGRPTDASVICYDPDPVPVAGQIVFFSFNYGAAATGERELLLHNAVHWLITTEIGGSGLSGTVELSGETDHSGSVVTVTPGDLETVTGPEGTYSFDDLLPGTYQVTVTHEGYAAATADVDVEPGQMLSGVDFTLLPFLTLERCTDPAAPIPDDDPAGVESGIIVGFAGPVGGIEVYVDISHTYIADLDVDLISPSGTVVALHQMGQGGGTDDIVGWYPVELAPHGDLNDLLGEPIQGVWTLRVVDNGPVDTGTLNSWCVRLIYAGTPVAVGDEDVPSVLALDGNYPNPFNPMTKIRFAVPTQQRVDLAVYDVRGQKVTTLISQVLPAGRHEVTWAGRDDLGRTVSSGTYFYRLIADGQTLTSKMLLLK